MSSTFESCSSNGGGGDSAAPGTLGVQEWRTRCTVYFLVRVMDNCSMPCGLGKEHVDIVLVELFVVAQHVGLKAILDDGLASEAK